MPVSDSPLSPDWLIDRRHCDNRWHGECKVVREGVAAAVKGLPPSEQLAWVNDTDCE